MFGIDDVLTGGLSLASGFMNNMFAGQRQDQAQQFNAQQAAMNRQWQEQMDNTKYQRTANDMQAAGLNRILAVGGPGGTPGGSTASSPAPAAVHDMLGAGVSTAMAHARLKNEIENMQATNDNIMKDTRLKVVQGNTEDEKTRTQAAETLRTLADTKYKDTSTQHTAQEIVKGSADAIKAQTDAEQYKGQAMKVLRQTGNIGTEVQRASSAVGNLPGILNARNRGKEIDLRRDTFKERFGVP